MPGPGTIPREDEIRPYHSKLLLDAHDAASPKPAPGLEAPGAFQCAILRAFELPEGYRDVFLLKEIQGYTLAEIAAILGISIDTALDRFEIGYPGDSDAMEHAK
jgi:DNA-directed RNA polymerase specialized sigma24 family protein